MKRLLQLFVLLLFPALLFAQTEPIFLFEKFTAARVHFKSGSVTVNLMNYDACRGKMYFVQDGNFMEMTNVNMVDTIAWGIRKFIPCGNRFREVFKRERTTVYVDWLLKDVHLGTKGAFGLPTQGKVETLKLGDFSGGVSINHQVYDAQGTYDKDVWNRKSDNTYYFMKDDKLCKVRNVKQLYELFENRKFEIRAYVKKENIDMKLVEDALKVIDYSFSL